MDIDHLDGGEFLQGTSGGQPGRQGMQTALQRDLPAASQARDEDMGFDPALDLMEDQRFAPFAVVPGGRSTERRVANSQRILRCSAADVSFAKEGSDPRRCLWPQCAQRAESA
jgi:hypothetical protein